MQELKHKKVKNKIKPNPNSCSIFKNNSFICPMLGHVKIICPSNYLCRCQDVILSCISLVHVISRIFNLIYQTSSHVLYRFFWNLPNDISWLYVKRVLKVCLAETGLLSESIKFVGWLFKSKYPRHWSLL